MRHERRPGVVNINLLNESGGGSGPWTGPWSPTNTMGSNTCLLWLQPSQESSYADLDPVTVLHDWSGHGYDMTTENADIYVFHASDDFPYIDGIGLGEDALRNVDFPALGGASRTLLYLETLPPNDVATWIGTTYSSYQIFGLKNGAGVFWADGFGFTPTSNPDMPEFFIYDDDTHATIFHDHTGGIQSGTYTLDTSSGVTIRSGLEGAGTTYPAGRFYAFVVWDGVLSSDDITAAISYFTTHIPNWVDVAGLDGAIYSSDSSTSNEDLAVDRNVDTRWSSDEADTAWWQVAFPDPQTIQRIDLVPHADDGYSGIPYFQLLASNTGDFDGEEVLLTENDLFNHTRAYNVFFFENSTAYTYYRLLISGLTSVQYMIEEVFLYVVE